MNHLALRRTSLFLAIMAGIFGLFSRKFPEYLPLFLSRYAGDTMWAFALYYLIRIIFPLKTIIWNSLVCLTLSVLVEVSQLYQADWINIIRHTLIGALILGNTFVWSDLLCYLSGCILAGLIDFLFIQRLIRNCAD